MSKAANAFCFLLPLLLVLPFDPQWPDFERARRGVLLALVGAQLLAFGPRPTWSPRPFAWLLALAGLGLASAAWAKYDAWAALETGAYWTALFSVPWILRPEWARPLIRGVALALLLTALFGVLQCAGLELIPHYRVAQEPVSSLGNRNVAAEWTALASPLALLAMPLLGWTAVFCGDLYLWGNGGRAGLIAFHFGVVAMVWFGRRAKAFPEGALRATLAMFVVAAVLGTLFLQPKAARAVRQEQQRIAAEQPAGGTIAVRLKIWPRALRLARDNVLAGVGAGNFAAAFPPYRDLAEIDISSFGHRIATRVTNPHNDVLWIASELGVLGLVLVSMFVLAIVRAASEHRIAAIGLAALCAIVPVALTRAPLGNAPAAFSCMLALWLGMPPEARPIPALVRVGARALGLPLCLLGFSILLGEGGGAGFLRAKRHNDPRAGVAAIDRAIRFDPIQTDWRLLRAQVHHKPGSKVPAKYLDATLQDLDAVLQRRPNEAKALADLGYLGLVHGEHAFRDGKLRIAGLRATAHLLDLDPKHPQALFLAADYAFLAGKPARGLLALERLGLEAPIVAKLRQIRALVRKEENPQRKIELTRVQLSLRKLLRKLFPRSAELR